MAKKLKLKVEVEVSNFESEDGYYSFDYVYSIDGKIKKKQKHESDFENEMTDKEWIKYLEDGHALEIAMEEIADDLEL